MATTPEWLFRKYTCAGCDKGFSDIKRLLQHRNACTKYEAVVAYRETMTTEAYLALERSASKEDQS